MTRHIVPDEVLTRPESLAEAQPLAQLPTTPFAFIWYLVRTHFPKRVATLIALAALAAAGDSFGPLAFKYLTNAVTGAYKHHLGFSGAVLPWIIIMGAIWLVSASIYRLYEALDVADEPAHARARAEIPLRLHAGSFALAIFRRISPASSARRSSRRARRPSRSSPSSASTRRASPCWCFWAASSCSRRTHLMR